MTDSELLELAAKAVGIDLNQVNGPIVNGGVRLQDNWNPLEKDGDALRLAVKLDLQIAKNSCGTMAIAFRPVGLQINEPLGEDPYAATRSAIVRAAAEIGKGMK